MIVCILLLHFLYLVSSNNNYYNHNYHNIQIRNAGFKLIIFKEKTLPKFVKKITSFYEMCYYKSMISIAEGLSDYNNLSEEDRTLIETIISLCY
jgi:hypothetical protein